MIHPLIIFTVDKIPQLIYPIAVKILSSAVKRDLYFSKHCLKPTKGVINLFGQDQIQISHFGRADHLHRSLVKQLKGAASN